MDSAKKQELLNSLTAELDDYLDIIIPWPSGLTAEDETDLWDFGPTTRGAMGIADAPEFHCSYAYQMPFIVNNPVITFSLIDSTDTRVIDALAKGGYFGKKHINDSSIIVKDFVTIREDMKKTAKKGVETVDLFG